MTSEKDSVLRMLFVEDLLITLSAFHVSPVLDVISTLNFFDSVSLKLQHGGCLFDNGMMGHFGENEGA